MKNQRDSGAEEPHRLEDALETTHHVGELASLRTDGWKRATGPTRLPRRATQDSGIPGERGEK